MHSLKHLIKCHNVDAFYVILKMVISYDISIDIFWFTRDTILLI
jgi:hypothetical protein